MLPSKVYGNEMSKSSLSLNLKKKREMAARMRKQAICRSEISEGADSSSNNRIQNPVRANSHHILLPLTAMISALVCERTLFSVQMRTERNKRVSEQLEEAISSPIRFG